MLLQWRNLYVYIIIYFNFFFLFRGVYEPPITPSFSESASISLHVHIIIYRFYYYYYFVHTCVYMHIMYIHNIFMCAWVCVFLRVAFVEPTSTSTSQPTADLLYIPSCKVPFASQLKRNNTWTYIESIHCEVGIFFQRISIHYIRAIYDIRVIIIHYIHYVYYIL